MNRVRLQAKLLRLFGAIAVLLMCSPLIAADISGQIKLSSGGKALRSVEAVDGVVYFRPRTPVAPVAPVAPELPFVLSTERKSFTPRVLPIPAGSTVVFPNNDPILHNAFSTSTGNTFDVGLYGQGDQGEPVRFVNPGLVRVYCNVHHNMVAHIVVLDTPFFAVPDEQGRFRISNVPEGPGELLLWHERSTLWRKPVLVDGDVQQEISLELNRRRVPQHLNKFGKPYRRSREDGY